MHGIKFLIFEILQSFNLCSDRFLGMKIDFENITLSFIDQFAKFKNISSYVISLIGV